MDAVSEVLVDRGREMSGIERMLGASVVAHVGLVALIVLSPAGWWSRGEAVPESVMTISLSAGEDGPIPGMTALSARPVQSVATEVPKRIDPVRPPAAQAPEMIEPLKNAPKKNETKADLAAKDPKSKTPTKGTALKPGNAVAETGAKGQGFGLSQGGFNSTGSYLDTANFCCPEYVATMERLVKGNWDSRQRTTGATQVKFTIQRSGVLTDVSVSRSSGYQTLDFLAQRAILLTRQLPPLPAAYTEPSLTVYLVFEYQ